jgi:general secretion pathway protein B
VAYGELPAAVQGALPNIVFGGFAGGGETEGRIAFINNRLVREGEEVSPGLRLETVDQGGVVLGFQGHRFRTGQ